MVKRYFMARKTGANRCVPTVDDEIKAQKL
jgi:hypothetical protein